MHVNSQLEEKALVIVFNPLNRPAEKILDIPLYYTGKTDKVAVSREDGPSAEYRLDRRQSLKLPVQLSPQSVTWYVIQ